MGDPIEPMRSGGPDRRRDAATSAAPCTFGTKLPRFQRTRKSVVNIAAYQAVRCAPFSPKDFASAEAQVQRLRMHQTVINVSSSRPEGLAFSACSLRMLCFANETG